MIIFVDTFVIREIVTSIFNNDDVNNVDVVNNNDDHKKTLICYQLTSIFHSLTTLTIESRKTLIFLIRNTKIQFTSTIQSSMLIVTYFIEMFMFLSTN